ncbi:MAG: SDR family oxidoreductase [Hellea sp.]|nr:SDR family oxidoreductase [Hellea sp.]
MDFKDKTIIVTGGSRGIGKGIAAAFLKAGASVVICGRREPDDLPSGVHFISLDIRKEDAGEKLVEFAIKKTGRVDCLVNNAGGTPIEDAQQASAALVSKIINLNLIAPINLSREAYPELKKNRGSIINISSVSGSRPSPKTAAYGAAKAGLLNYTTSLAMEWAPDIRVNAIIVGLVETEASEVHYGGEKGIAHLSSELPMGRMGAPEDIAKACLFLADPANDYVSGACLEVHGGGEPPSFLKIAQEAFKLG